VAIAYCRFVYRYPLKSIPFRLASGFFTELLGLGPFNEKQASGILNRIGGQPDKKLQYASKMPVFYKLLPVNNYKKAC
jgi:hypothetical protein